MAPYPSYRKQVKFAKSRPTPQRRKPTTAESYANIVLHYLSKLKGIFQSPETVEKTPYYKKERYTDHERRREYSDNDEVDTRGKACAIVNAAIQYGCANNIIEKVGKYILLKTSTQGEQKGIPRRSTPGRDYFRCDACKKLTKVSQKCSFKNDRATKFTSRSKKHRTYYDECGTTTKRRRRSRFNTCRMYCPKCCRKMKSHRKH